MLRPFSDEELVEIGGEKLRLVLNFKAIDVIEGLADQPMPVVLVQFFSSPSPMGLQGKVLWALLREAHPEVTLDEAAGVMFSEHANRAGQAVSDLLQRAFNLGEPKKEKGKNPPKPRGASKPS